jgi:hypothetical protein
MSMAYKGTDLDLRTPRPATNEITAAAPSERAANGGTARFAAGAAGPIFVDATLLASCNRAYDIARFHASPDVRLEHLLHALTRVGAAQQALTELGIRLDALRRDTAVAIAADLPASSLEADGNPQASAALEDVLRRAAGEAARWHDPAGVHDLIRSMLGGGPGAPAAALVLQAATDPQRLERWREAPRRTAIAPEAIAGSATGPLSPGIAEALLGRLDTMAATMQALQAQAAADRQALSDLLRDLSSLALRGEGAPAAAALNPHAVEALKGKLGELDTSLSALGHRLTGIDKLASASDVWGDISQELRTRLEVIEGRLGTPTLEAADRIAEAFANRFEKTETGLKDLQEETEKHWTSSSERQIALEASVRAHLQSAEAAGKKHERDLNEIYQALVKLGANQQTLGDNFTAWRIESGGDIGIISNRLQQLEQTMLDRLGRLGADLRAWRQERREGKRRGEGFKRWLYGTANVFAWRDEAPAGKAPAKTTEQASKAQKTP